MSDSVVYDNIFEAIRSLDSNHLSLRALKDDNGGLIKRQNYEILKMANGKYGYFLPNLGSVYFRGEPEIYTNCFPSIYRIKDITERIIAKIRAIDFTLYLENRFDIKKEIEKNRYIDFLALAQHYGFATNMLDLTSDLMTAAYFATHIFDPYLQDYAVAADGIGQIRAVHGSEEPIGKIRLIGLQPLARPGLQSAYGMVLKDGEDFSQMSRAVCFRQNVTMNQRFHSLFLQGADLYFPQETEMNYVSKLIKESPTVTSNAVIRYCEQTGESFDSVAKLLIDSDIYVVDAPLVCENMPLSVQMRIPTRKVRNIRPIITIG